MTTTRAPASPRQADGLTAPRPRSAAPADQTSTAPIIILTYPHSGAERLQALLARHHNLACTTGTGILPLCDQAAAAWRAADGQPRKQLSALAAASTRATATAIITCLLARQGKRRWCETAIATPDTAATFLQLFPGTRILTLHRACPDFIRTALHAHPWGLASPAFTPFITAHPASTLAALTAYWTAHTALLISFEESHPDACHRLRYEDLAADPAPGLPDFLGLDSPQPTTPGWLEADEAATGSPADDFTAPFPAGQIPHPLLTQANQFLNNLGYEPLKADR
jgi:hypothetical protein